MSKMTLSTLKLVPPKNLGMTILDKSRFTKILKALGVKIQPTSVSQFLKKAHSELLNLPRFKNVFDLPEEKPYKLVLLKYGTEEKDITTLSPTMQELINTLGLGFIHKELELPYEYWSTDDVLTSIFPDDLPPPSSFTSIGHIAHLNLRDEYLPYKKIIGEVILDKNASIQTVVNKLDIIDSTFRNFAMEVLSGEDRFITTVKENDCQFKLDFSKVYWNSRLHTEHERIIKLFKPNQIICDVFAGVGPFALPAAKAGCQVYANDLNPSSHEYLLHNISLNKINTKNNPTKIIPFNLDGREFIRQAFTKLLASQTKENSDDPEKEIKLFNHVVMNLPATAIEFLDAFRNLIDPSMVNRIINTPTLHVHCFTRCLDTPLSDILARASMALGRTIDEKEDVASVHYVRKVAPNKDMYCLKFNLSVTDLSTPKLDPIANSADPLTSTSDKVMGIVDQPTGTSDEVEEIIDQPTRTSDKVVEIIETSENPTKKVKLDQPT